MIEGGPVAGSAVVLVVEPDLELRDVMGKWLEEAGYDVLACPGPSLPDYTCVAGRGKSCPLADGADVVVLDLWLGSDSVLVGTSATELLAYYLSSERPVVGLSARHDHTTLVNLFLEDPLFLVDSPPERRELCETVTAALRGREGESNQSGMLIRTVVPSPGTLSMESSPPREAARSRRLRSP